MRLAVIRTVICAAVTIAAAGILPRQWHGVSETGLVAWGATDPAWSPDGARLAFSLFGSIWQVAFRGGEARQVSSSGGYHAHPAWSPRGDLIVFVSGNPPVNSRPTISGKLRIVDIRTGEEREIAAPFPAAGTPAWSPDGTRIVCGLLVPDAGSLLHEIEVSKASVTRIQHPAPSPLVDPWTGAGWTDAAWSAKTGEIFFTAQRTSAPQVWSMPSGRHPILIQLPLTNYQRRDIVLLHSLSAFPDGSGAVYSADVVNGRGNYELYRVGREGGQPSTALTNTDRDEFNPAVSPDGRFIAHVSNQLGNMDLFVMPAAGGEKTHVRITDLKFSKPFGRVRLKVLDEQGNP
ncbi:MAG: hypothetical protein L0387_31465, partial [Acidobacteria bacterium]|nr:hypothetical protein [Acidobacteriota bacterium]